jgi:signal transduction histidine kinase
MKYTPGTGAIVIATKALENAVQIAVQDSGTGIPAGLKDKIFDRFFRIMNADVPSTAGMGLGLFITAGIVKRHGGHITVESEEGKGATFYVTLPCEVPVAVPGQKN